MKKSVLSSPRLVELKKKKHQILRRKILFFLLLFILITTFLSFFSKWKEVNINNIVVLGNKVIETKTITDLVNEKITGNYFYFFPKTNFLFFPKNEIIKGLREKFKRLDNISLNIKNIKTLEISLSERTALYTWCGDTLPELNNLESNITDKNKCYFMDENGYIFDEAPYFSDDVYLKFYGKTDVERLESGSPTSEINPSGSYFLQTNFKKIISFKETIKKLGMKPSAFFAEDNGDAKMFLSSSSASKMGPSINFKIDFDMNKAIENLQSVLTTEPLQSDFKNKYNSLIYIDLRFGNKVYYKFR
ncbi:MAG: hypothetical protein WC839_01170 [Candidatus Paceibacterota bacterium]